MCIECKHLSCQVLVIKGLAYVESHVLVFPVTDESSQNNDVDDTELWKDLTRN